MDTRKTVFCSSCGKEWDIKEDDYWNLKVCPFCVAEYKFPKEEVIVDSFPNAILKVISSFGINVLSERSRFLSCLLDYAPEYKKEVKIVSRVCTQDTFSEMVRWSSINEAGQTASIARMKTLFVEEEGLSDEWADKIIEGFSYAIIPARRQQIEKAAIVQPPIQKQNVPNTHKTPQSKNVETPDSENDNILLFISPTDPKCVMAKKYLSDADISFNCIDVVKYPAVAGRFSANQTPLLTVYKNGKEEKRIQGIESIKNFCSGNGTINGRRSSLENESVLPSRPSDSDQYTATVYNASLNKVLRVEKAREVVLDKSFTMPAGFTFKGRSDINLVIIDGCSVSNDFFNGCSNLKAVFISSCSRIGENAFANCKSLRYVIFDGHIAPSLGLWAFDCCPSETLFVYKWDNRYSCKSACERLARKPGQVVLYNPVDKDLACIVEYARKKIGGK